MSTRIAPASAHTRWPWLATTLIGVCAALISLGRLWLGNHAALTQVVWAEDGLFPLCVTKVGFARCLIDPFAGYLLVLPRLFAGVVSVFPASSWALVTNLLAAMTAGLTSAGVYAVMRRSGTSALTTVTVSLVPVIIPIVGLESLNALGSTYMLLLFGATMMLAFARESMTSTWQRTAGGALLLLVTSLTIPLAGMLILIVLLQAFRRRIRWRAAWMWLGAIAIGCLAQVITARTAAVPRPIHVDFASVHSWVDATVSSILTFIPGLELHRFTAFQIFPISPSGLAGILVVVGIAVLGCAQFRFRDDRHVAIGLLLLFGLADSFIPSVIGWASNRYFVTPCLLWAAALLVALDPVIRRARRWMVLLAVIVAIAVWWPMIPASWYRSTPAPAWQSEVARVAASCHADPTKTERPVFSPYWPPNWGDGLAEPTHPDVPCLLVWGWH